MAKRAKKKNQKAQNKNNKKQAKAQKRRSNMRRLKTNTKVKTYMIKKNSKILVFNLNKEGKLQQSTSHNDVIFGIDESHLIEIKKCSCCDDLIYYFDYNDVVIGVDSKFILKTHLSIDEWIANNQHLKDDIAPRIVA